MTEEHSMALDRESGLRLQGVQGDRTTTIFQEHEQHDTKRKKKTLPGRSATSATGPEKKGRAYRSLTEAHGMVLDRGSSMGVGVGARRRRARGAAANTTLTTACVAALALVANLQAEPVLALQCFSCADCSVGVALSASKQQCPPEDTFCATVSRPQVDGWGDRSSSIHRGCASSLSVACEPSNTTRTSTMAATTRTTQGTASDHHGRETHRYDSQGDAGSKRVRDSGDDNRGGSASLPPLCCSADLCNGSEDVRAEGQRRSEEHLRILMEGNPRRRREGLFSWGFSSGAGDVATVGSTNSDVPGPKRAAAADHSTVDGEDGNSAQSARAGGVGGSRFATVLVIVGTFSHVLWLVSRLIEE
ncbi:unnamed protein product [Scytosiphon promiscuus]